MQLTALKQNFKLTIICVLIAMMSLPIGCSNNNWKSTYATEYNNHFDQARKQCTDYGQKYLQLYLDTENKEKLEQNVPNSRNIVPSNNNQWMVICYQESPYKTIKKVVNIEPQT